MKLRLTLMQVQQNLEDGELLECPICGKLEIPEYLEENGQCSQCDNEQNKKAA